MRITGRSIMCLVLDKNWKDQIRKWKTRKRKKPIIVYKRLWKKETHVYTQNAKSPQMWLKTFVEYYSVYKNYKWEKGLNISDRGSTVIAQGEIIFGVINEGFHFYINKEDARYGYYRFASEVVCKFEIDPEDIVAVGTWEGVRNIVATKAKFLGEV